MAAVIVLDSFLADRIQAMNFEGLTHLIQICIEELKLKLNYCHFSKFQASFVLANFDF